MPTQDHLLLVLVAPTGSYPYREGVCALFLLHLGSHTPVVHLQAHAKPSHAENMPTNS